MNEKAAELTKTLLGGHFYEPARVAAEKWLTALGTDAEAEAEAAYIPMLKESVATLDEVLALFGDPAVAEKFGAERAKQIYAHALQQKEAGEKYCDCPACSTALQVLALLGVDVD